MPTAAVREPGLVDAIMAALKPSERRWCSLPGCDCRCANELVSRDEWTAWFIRHSNQTCERCDRPVHRLGRDGRSYLACETCDMAWA